MKFSSLTTRILIWALALNHITSTAFAAEVMIYSKDIFEIRPNTAILDFDDSGGDISLQFGNVLGEALNWDQSNNRFVFTDDLKVQGNIAMDGNNFYLDDDNVGAGVDVNIIANQGSDADGILRYNSTLNIWEFSNDSVVFQPLGGSVADSLSAVQIRRNTDFTMAATNTWYDMDFPLTDLENQPGVIDHDNSNLDRINILEDGLYRITYQVNSNDGGTTHQVDHRVRLNDSTVLNGSLLTGREYQNEFVPTTANFLAELTAGDFLTLQVQRTTAATIINEATVTVVKLEGVQGPEGPQGTPGSVGLGTDETSFTIDQDNAGAGADVSIIANQGANPDGVLRYNSTTNEWELSNDGGAYNAISTGTNKNYLFGYTTTDQPISLLSTFEEISFTNPTVLNDGWVHNSNDFNAPATGLYFVNYTAHVARSSNGDATVTIRVLRNGSEIPGSVSYASPYRGNRPVAVGNGFLVNLTAGDQITFEQGSTSLTGSPGLRNNNALGSVQPTFTMSISRVK